MFRLGVSLLLLAGTAPALEIKEKRWGFDGRVRAERFNILSLLVVNPDAHPFDGQLVLEDRRGLEKAAGAPVVQPIYLAAGTRRWVQFPVFINQPGGDWKLRWGKGPRDLEMIDGAQGGPPARVLLTDPEAVSSATGGLRAFPDDLFPTSVAATDALAAVALDHVPRWEPARREAFLDWLRRGGTVHLLHGADGQFPQFSEAFGILNTDARLGAGLIMRHEAVRAEVSDRFLAERGFPAPELKEKPKVLIYDLEAQLLQKLAALTRPQIAWWLIYLLTAGYVAVVGPLHYHWSKKLPWLRSIALLLGIVAGFGGAFAFAGRRGANETQQIHALALAHSLGGGRHDVTQWISAFATRGALYKLTHGGPANFYSTASGFDSVNGAIVNGRGGFFEVDIPLFSTRPFLQRGVLTGDRTEVGISEWQVDKDGFLEKLALTPGADLFQKAAHVWLRHRDRFYELDRVGQRWELGKNTAAEAAAFFPEEYFHRIMRNSSHMPGVIMFGRGEVEEKEGGEWMRDAGKLLIARALGSIEGLAHPLVSAPPPADRLQLYLDAPLPDGFRIQDPRFGLQEGRVLYVQDLFRP